MSLQHYIRFPKCNLYSLKIKLTGLNQMLDFMFKGSYDILEPSPHPLY